MTSATRHHIDQTTSSAITLVEQALETVFSDREAKVTPSTEANVQKALLLLRANDGDAEVLRKVEHISTLLFTMAQSLRAGRPNLYASQRLRLKRLAYS